MCEYLDYEVSSLKRIRIINITLDVQEGKYRNLTDAEVAELNKLIEPSSKTEEASLQSNKGKFTGKRNYGERNR
jgi:23S rRNA pseudouridine2604 synthase